MSNPPQTQKAHSNRSTNQRVVRPPLWKFVRHSLVAMAIVFGLTLVAEKFGLFRVFETHGLDIMLNLHTPPESATIVLVTIDDEDYESIFHGTSPLDPLAIHNAITQIQRGKPAVIAVDLETVSDRFAGFDWPDAVWVRSAKTVGEDSGTSLEQSYSQKALEKVQRGKFLGGKGQELEPDHEHLILTQPTSGLSLFLADSDGVIRRFRHLFFSSQSDPASDQTGYVESFPWAICRKYAEYLSEHGQENSPVSRRIKAEEHRETEARAEEVILSFGGSRNRFRRINLRNLLQASEESYWEQNSPIQNAIVILGGAYSASRDVYITPAGPRQGMELIAHTIETNLAHGGIREINHRLANILDIAVGLLTIMILWLFPGHRAFVFTMLASAALALIGSYVAFQSFAHWFNFAPMVGGLWLHFQWEKRKENQELLHEIQTLKAELARLQSATPALPPPEPPKNSG